MHRWRRIVAAAAALVSAGAVALAGPGLASGAGPVPCTAGGSVLGGSWQGLTIGSFPAVEGVASAGRVTSYAVDPADPTRVFVTDGTSVLLSDRSGCGFRPVLSLPNVPDSQTGVSGSTARIVSVAVAAHRPLLLVSDGVGDARRPRVITSPRGEAGTWTTVDSGLPATGAPGELVVAPSEPSTVYLTVTPTGNGVATGAGVPVNGVGAGVLYGSTDAGQTWSLRSDTTTLSLARPIEHLAVDPAHPDRLWAIIGGHLLVSGNSGAAFGEPTGLSQGGTDLHFSALAMLGAGSVIGFADRSSNGPAAYLGSIGAFRTQGAPAGVVESAATRGTDGTALMLAVRSGSSSRLVRYDVSGARSGTVSPPFDPQAGLVEGTQGAAPTWTAVSPTRFLRYLDTRDRGQVVDDDTFTRGIALPPRPGDLLPRQSPVSVPKGATRTVDYELDLPANPTPLDVFFLVDTSKSWADFIGQLQSQLGRVASDLAGLGIDINIGIGAIGTAPGNNGPGRPCAPDPPADPTIRGYRKPVLYERLRAVGPVDAGLQQALSNLKVETSPDCVERLEGQLIALQQASDGTGVLDPSLSVGGGVPVYSVAPDQVAGWRQLTQRIIVLGADDALSNPPGTPRKPDGSPDFDSVIASLNRSHASVISLSRGFVDAVPDLRRLALGTRTVAPPSGIDCGEDDGSPESRSERYLEPGDPVVCPNQDDFTIAIEASLRALAGSGHIDVRSTGHPGLVASIDAPALDSVDLFEPRRLGFQVSYRCDSVAPGRYEVGLETRLRGAVVGTATAVVECLPAAAVVVARPQAPEPPPLRPEPAPAPLAPVAVAPAPAQPNPPVQANPQPAAAAQDQEQPQLALAQQDEEDPDASTEEAFDSERPTLAMSRRARDQQAVGVLLAGALVSCAGAGLVLRRRRLGAEVLPQLGWADTSSRA